MLSEAAHGQEERHISCASSWLALLPAHNRQGQDFAISAISHSARRNHACCCWLACSGLQPCWRCTQSSILQHWPSHNTHFLPPSGNNHLVTEAFTSSGLFPHTPQQLHAGVTQSHTWCLMSVCLCGYLPTASD